MEEVDKGKHLNRSDERKNRYGMKSLPLEIKNVGNADQGCKCASNRTERRAGGSQELEIMEWNPKVIHGAHRAPSLENSDKRKRRATTTGEAKPFLIKKGQELRFASGADAPKSPPGRRHKEVNRLQVLALEE